MADSPDKIDEIQAAAESEAETPADVAAADREPAADSDAASNIDAGEDQNVAREDQNDARDEHVAAGEPEGFQEPAPGERTSDGPDDSGEPRGDEAGAVSELSQETAEDDELAEAALGRATAELKSIVEALIFASPEPLTPKALLKLLDTEPKEDVLSALEEVKADYLRPGGLQIVEVAGGCQIVTRPDLHEWVRRLFHERSSQKLSVQALETLAVIAYRQPITALEITEIRGVSASGVLNTLLERHLIKIVGRKQVVGRPFMYATTKEFLIRFGLKDLSDLPKVEDMAESLGIDSPLLVEQTPPEEQLPLSEPDDAAVSSVSGGDLDDAAGEDDASGEPTTD